MELAPRNQDESPHKRVTASKLKKGDPFVQDEDDETPVVTKDRSIARHSNSGRPLLLKLESPKVSMKTPVKSSGRQSAASQQLMESEFSEQDMRDLQLEIA